mgnify:CR=1 FL=1
MNQFSVIATRLAWIVPIFFLGLSAQQARVAYTIQQTLTRGAPVTAEVLELHQENRVDVTYDYVSLRVEAPSGAVLTKKKMSLPHSLAPALEGQETLAVRVQEGATQEVVIAQLGGTQWRIAAMNAAMALVGALVFGAGVWWWSRYLRREGDPSARGVTESDADHPAREIVRER